MLAATLLLTHTDEGAFALMREELPADPQNKPTGPSLPLSNASCPPRSSLRPSSPRVRIKRCSSISSGSTCLRSTTN